MKFVKMHGAGNDYVYLDAVTDPALEARDLPALARAISDRHRGVGGDGLILVCGATDPAAHVRMRMFNADGSEAQMCGNGVRCVAKLARDRLSVAARPLVVQTARGLLPVETIESRGRVVAATVAMGPPILEPAAIPVDRAGLAWSRGRLHGVDLGPAGVWAAVLVSMGNPHAVLFDLDNSGFAAAGTGSTAPRSGVAAGSNSDLSAAQNEPAEALLDLDLSRLGPAIERHRAFPARVNAHFAVIESRDRVRVRTWERGTGETMACGTGACAVLVAGVLTDRLDHAADILVRGGTLRADWPSASGDVLLTGPADDAFEGDWPD